MERATHDRRRRDIALLVLIQSAVVLWWALRSDGAPGVDRELLVSVAFGIALAIGLWRAHAWARWACATIGLFLATAYLGAGFIVLLDGGSVPNPVVFLPLSILWCVIGTYLLQRSTREAFADAREGGRSDASGTSRAP